jgi:hypothetical protein
VTAARYVTIWCDGKVRRPGMPTRDCGNYAEGDTAAAIRSEPMKGWLMGLPGGRDLCPEHVDQRDQTTRWGIA